VDEEPFIQTDDPWQEVRWPQFARLAAQ